MNILALETTGANASVAVINEAGQVFEEASSETLNHLQFLMPMVGKLLEKCQLQIGDVHAVAASEGPGSFTGIRIGVSSARALAQALGIQCIGVPTLKSFLYSQPGYSGIFCPIFDARRSQVYGGAYKWKGPSGQSGRGLERMEEIVKGGAYSMEELLRLLEGQAERVFSLPGESGGCRQIMFFGDGVDTYAQQVEEWKNSSLNSDIQVKFAEEGARYQKASSVARLARDMYLEGKTCGYNQLEPNYMRKAEAERKLEAAGQALSARAETVSCGAGTPEGR